jgi:1-acyl-sn-glycerol-3-phosphate acyltransferase
MSLFFRAVKGSVDVIITLIFWCYFLLGYIFFIPVLIFMTLFARDLEGVFQKANNIFYRIFFKMLVVIVPGLAITVDKGVYDIHAAMVIANHRSYLDPILLISLFPKHKTIVKGVFFKIPIMRWVMKSGGYIPFAQSGRLQELMVEEIRGLESYKQQGGVMFIFPEGKRSRDGKLGKLQKGAFSIAEKYNMPVEVVYIRNTERLFMPGKFFLNTCVKNTITVDRLGRIETVKRDGFSTREMRDRALQMYLQKMKSEKNTDAHR